jgi:uncharacterized protein YecE (DUF72 family)
VNEPPRRPQQQGLFGPLDEESPATVRAAPVAADVAALAAALPRTLRLGTSSWAFAGWSGFVYAARTVQARLPRHGLAAYAQHPLLRAVGLDRTFYAPMTGAELAGLAAVTPADFRFVVKAPSECTDPVRRGDGGRPERSNERWLDAAFARDFAVAPAVQGLGERLGTLVFQFPPQGDLAQEPARFAARLGAFLGALPKPVPCAVELRDAALLTADYAAVLRDAGVQHCYSVHPRMPALSRQLEVVPLTGPAVVRWLLHPGLGYDEAKARYEPFDRLVDPDPARRADVADLVRRALALSLPVTVVANNKAEGSAPRTLLELARLLVGAAH